MKPQLSVIIPIKNMEKYIEKCLNTIFHSTIKDLEVIIVDFGSTDMSIKIVDTFALKYPSLRVYHDIDGDAATARQLGLEVARGIYISFIDADDWIELNMFESLINAAKNKSSDIVGCGYKFIKENNGEVTRINPFNYNQIVSESNINKTLIDIAYGKYNLEVWNKIYLREFLINNEVKFNNHGGVNGEDVLFNLQCIIAKPKIFYTEEIGYNHLMRENSLANCKKKDLSFRFMTIIDILHKHIIKKNVQCDLGLSQVMLSLMIQDLIGLTDYSNDLKRSINTYHQFSFINDYLSLNISNKSINKSRRLFAFLIAHKCYMLLRLFLQMKKRS